MGDHRFGHRPHRQAPLFAADRSTRQRCCRACPRFRRPARSGAGALQLRGATGIARHRRRYKPNERQSQRQGFPARLRHQHRTARASRARLLQQPRQRLASNHGVRHARGKSRRGKPAQARRRRHAQRAGHGFSPGQRLGAKHARRRALKTARRGLRRARGGARRLSRRRRADRHAPPARRQRRPVRAV